MNLERHYLTVVWEVTSGNGLGHQVWKFRSPLRPGLLNGLRNWIIPVNTLLPNTLQENLHAHYCRRKPSQGIKNLGYIRDKSSLSNHV